MQQIALPKSELNSIQAIIEGCIQAVENLIIESLHSHVNLINNVSHHIISSGGKRLRPLTLILSAKAAGYQGKEHIAMAAAIEFIHTATLLHDDVVDDSNLRRGKKTAHVLFGNEAAVLVGDYLYTKAFQLCSNIGMMPIVSVLSNATNFIAEGEVLQLIDCRNIESNEADYLHIIQYKTAKLFEAAAEIGGLLADSNVEVQKALANFGMHLGTAFQLIDDCLDYRGSPTQTGKTRGNDLLEGKVTLPLIYAIKNATAKDAIQIQSAIANPNENDFSKILDILEKSGAIEYTEKFAAKEIAKAHLCLKSLPNSPYREALHTLADYAIHRTL